ncbi:hypothetical protein [Kineococcus glutinatus]|uniref:Uncharacterized protein n=1 Tax=Kineococcus glutinatus TaxID=1070872 RepID=A0ABP9HU30_9ACTN
MAEDAPRREQLHDDDRDVPFYYRRPRSKRGWVDALFQGMFTFTGPAHATYDPTPPRGPRTEEEAAAGYGEWDRVTNPDGTSFLVPRRRTDRG